MDFREKSYVPNPRETSNPLSAVFFWWMFPLFRKGAKKELSLDDMYNVLREDVADRLGNELGMAWDKEVRKSKLKMKRPKLYRAIIKVFGLRYFLCGICEALAECIIKPVQTLCLKWLIESLSLTKAEEENLLLKQYLYAGGLCLTTFLNTILIHPCVFAFNHIGMKIRVATSSLIYRKTLRVSKASESHVSVGKLVNLLSNDVSRFDMNLFMLHYFYIGPIQTIILTYLLWVELGPSCMAGTGFILLITPIQYFIGKMFTIYRFQIAEKTDRRGKIMNEIIIAVRVIKMYAWEKPFSYLIDQIRRMEVKVLRKAAYLRAFYLSLYMSSAKIITFLTFITYVLVDENHVLRADQVFFAVAIFNIMRQVMVSFVPTAAAATGELIVSMDRIESYLLMEEQETGQLRVLLQAGLDQGGTGDGEKNRAMIKMENACASWNGDKVTLDHLNVSLEGDQLVIVCGSVGSGKTSFLHALIAELPIIKGSCLVQGKTSYTAGQEPWIFSGNVRQNILFGHPYDKDRYKEIVSVCALEDDMNQFQFGDKTVVGERGVSLSGGQKARVNLARALYEPADIYLLDDPLSAVDSRVSRHIFDKCIKKHLKGSLRVLVTHQLQYLPQADHIIVLHEGRIVAQGTYAELLEQEIDFVSLMATETQDDAGSRKESKAKLANINSNAVVEEKAFEGQPEDQDEKMATGSVDPKLYWNYFKSGNSIPGFVFLATAYIVNQILFSASDIWLSNWTNEEELRHAENQGQNTTTPVNHNYLGRDVYIYVYTALTVAILVVTKARGLYFFHFCMAISINIHNKMFTSVIRAPTKFFDENPSGRIMNRFTKDLGSMDELLPAAFYDALSIFLILIGVLIVVVISNYYMIIPTVAVLIVFWFMRRYFIRTARSVKRIESVVRSPLFTHLAASVQGLTTIRSSKSQTILIRQFDSHQDIHSAAWYIFVAANRWFAIWLEIMSTLFLTAVTIGFLLSSDTMGGSIGLAISSVLTLTGTLQWGMRQSAETENLMTSVERALEYANLKPEAELEGDPDKKPPKDWPTAGKIEFSKVSLAYTDKAVLHDLTFVINGKEKVGIVGRTGAGKSSIISALFRLTEPTGSIVIDGINVGEIGLHELRRNISIIPQDPVLFSGTVRYNLDPFDEHNDAEIWQAITEVDLKDEVLSLESQVSDGGSNFSIGQRQLVCLARAILRNNRIIVMDEATANVDPATDNLIQKTIRKKFVDCTILTIAHRLHSVMDCDRILVLDKGFLIEYDAPHILLQNPNGILTSMVRHTGKASSDILQRVAADAFSGKSNAFESLGILKEGEDDAGDSN